MTTLQLSHSEISRDQAIKLLVFPNVLTASVTFPDHRELKEIVQHVPERLEPLGIARLTVFSPCCVDPSTGQWITRENHILVNLGTEAPLDGASITVLDALPAGISPMSRQALIDLLPPTYFRTKEEAAKLTRVLNDSGPMTRGVR